MKTTKPKQTSPFQGFRYLLHEGAQFNRDKFIEELLIITRVTSLMALIIGIIGIVGWVTHTEILKSELPHAPAISTNSAICIVLLSLSLFLSTIWRENKFIKFLRDVLALLAFTIAAITLAEYIAKVNFGIDELLFRGIKATKNSFTPNRMALNTDIVFVFLSMSIFVLDKRIRRLYITHRLALLSAVVLIPTLISYLYGIDIFSNALSGASIPIPSTLSLLLLIIGDLVARPTHGIMNITTDESAGGFLARRLLISTILIPLALGYIIIWGYRLHLYDDDFRYLLIITANILIFSILIWKTSLSLHKVDSARRHGERNILFLTDASKVLSSSLDYKTTLRNVAKLAVPYIADWCAVDMLDEKGGLQLVTVAHKDPQKAKWARELRRLNPVDMSQKRGVPQVIRSGDPVIVPVVTDEMLALSARSPEELKLARSLHISSVIMVPILVERKAVGAIEFIAAESGYHYTDGDFAMAQELATRASLAIENAALYKKSQDAIRIRDEFISSASHELKTPLTSLQVYMQMLGKKLKDDEKTSAYVGKMSSQVNKLTTLIQDLLDVSKIQVGKLAFSYEPAVLSDLVKEVIDHYQPTVPDHKILLEGKADTPIQADRDRLGQVVLNLLTNAVKYSPNADKVLVNLNETEKYVSVSVQDFGIGIDKKYIGKIFNRFYQVKGPKEKTFPGLGMGLYISREIVRRHGGNLTVESEHNKGSFFTLSIPKGAFVKQE